MRFDTLENGYRVYMNPSDYQTMLKYAGSERCQLSMRMMGEAGFRVGTLDNGGDFVPRLSDIKRSTADGVDIWFIEVTAKDTKDRDTDGKVRRVWINDDLKQALDQYVEKSGLTEILTN